MLRKRDYIVSEAELNMTTEEFSNKLGDSRIRLMPMQTACWRNKCFMAILEIVSFSCFRRKKSEEEKNTYVVVIYAFKKQKKNATRQEKG